MIDIKSRATETKFGYKIANFKTKSDPFLLGKHSILLMISDLNKDS